MGTPEFAVPTLEQLNESFDIPLVITAPDRRRNRKKMTPTPVKKRAEELGLEVITPENVNDKEVLEKIRSVNPDFILEIAFGQLIKEDLLNILPDKLLNVHPSLLPKYRGASPIHQALLEGEVKTGNTIMLVEKGLDSGDILLQTEVNIEPQDDIVSLSEKLSKQGAEDAVYTLINYDTLYSNRKVQPEEYTYAKKITKEMGHIAWNKPVEEIHNIVRALKEWPGAYCFYQGERMKIFNGKISHEKTTSSPGEIIHVDESGVVVAALDGTYQITELQFPNKRKMAVGDYLRGNTIESGIQLE